MSRNYSNTAVQTTLASGVNDVVTSIVVSSTTGFPAVDFVLALDSDTATQELVLVTNVAGTTLTVTRGYDNTTAVAHDTGASVIHSHAAIDFREASEHIADTAAHGATGAVVGTTNVQSLSNKDLSSGTNTFPSTLATDVEVAAAQSAAEATADAALAAHEADTSTHGVTTVAGLDEVQTFTNKTLDSPTITGVGATQTVYKAADESVTSSITVQDDDHLFFTVVAGEVYIFEGMITTNAGPGGFRGNFNGPALTRLEAKYVDSSNDSRLSSYSSSFGLTGSGGHLKGLIECSVSGTVNFQWAQSISDASASTLKAGSWFRVTRIA
jgi:hypothetical protein